MDKWRHRHCKSCHIVLYIPESTRYCKMCGNDLYAMEQPPYYTTPTEDILPTLKEINESIKSIKESLAELGKCVHMYNAEDEHPIYLIGVEKWGD